MSTTVSYKGQTLATVSNQTKTLLTEGKYLEDDLTLVDVSGGGSTLITKSISANGTYNASSDSADGYSQVNVAVPASAVDTGTKNITANGNNQDVIGYAAVNVNVPNSYSASDEGKVVSNGALAAQTSDTVTANDTYDTTLISSLTVNVSGGGGDPDENLVKYIEGQLSTLNCDATTFVLPLRNTSIIQHIFLSECLSVPTGDCFYSNTGLIDIVLPKLTTLGATRQFYGCSNLEAVDFGSPSSIPASEFQSCTKLGKLILRGNSVTSLANVNAFNGTKFANGEAGGTIYVPSALINSYKGASNWSTLNGYGTVTWTAIEGSTYETHYADGTVIS